MNRPIIFSTEMVKAILEGRKTQTRRVIKPQPTGGYLGFVYERANHWFKNEPTSIEVKCPYGQPGDHLWVRETWRVCDHDFGAWDKEIGYPTSWLINYPADGETFWRYPPDTDLRKYADKFGTADTTGGPDSKLRPSIFMPRWASRIMLEVVNVRVEGVQEISLKDIASEGVYDFQQIIDGAYPNGTTGVIDAFKTLWNSINSKRGYSWDTNPFVWVVEFRKVD